MHINFSRQKHYDLYSIKIPENLVYLNKLKTTLSYDELIKAKQFKFIKDKNSYIICRGILRNILYKYICVPPEKIQLSYNHFGKPTLSYVHKTTKINFNISHSEDCCLIVVSMTHKIGVDIEKVNSLVELKSLAEFTFSKKEYDYLKKKPIDKQLGLFYSIWTQKESLIKASGKGLSFGLKSWSVIDEKDEYSITINSIEYHIKKINVFSGYYSAVCLIL